MQFFSRSQGSAIRYEAYSSFVLCIIWVITARWTVRSFARPGPSMPESNIGIWNAESNAIFTVASHLDKPYLHNMLRNQQYFIGF